MITPVGNYAYKRLPMGLHTLVNSTMLAFPTPGAKISLLVDASTFAVGAVRQQKVEGHQFPLGFFLRALSSTQQNYSTFDRELLGIFLAIKHFRYFVEGRPLIIWTDHAPLTHAIPSAITEFTGRRLRQLQFISEFTSDIRHIKGKENVVDDYLSRPPHSQRNISRISIDWSSANCTGTAERPRH